MPGPAVGPCTGLVVVEVDLDVVADVQVEEAVAVDVAPGAAGGEVRVVQAGPFRDVAEAPAAAAVGLVVVEDDAAEVGDDEVVEAVVVEVADGAAHAEAGPGQTHPLGHVGEGAIAVVAVQLVRRLRAPGAGGAKGSVLDAEEVGPAVVVVIDPAQAAAHALGHHVQRRAAVVIVEVDAAGGRHVLEPGQPGGRRQNQGLAGRPRLRRLKRVFLTGEEGAGGQGGKDAESWENAPHGRPSLPATRLSGLFRLVLKQQWKVRPDV